jgi:ribosomal protein L24E
VLLSTSKTKRLYILNKKKPAKLMWTQAWRRLNKKGKEEGVVKKKYPF